ncbi:UDP-N-acetylglucosamine 1-carboxyvinyltransferase [Brachyspira hyodysenteriae]|uniref:UDP-N-acetylglucosamine 1-carboxyvinyltransferase n=1 Tax=Brachyspira hyodysenteriae TaxID=159 RepID=UPI00063DA73A|nr:UDP-N-acetylglucosamine 1-carboxyvinyltransferase [Brachyspira hyodysenteriae]KLI58430.1 UDP-N-acetylglucosamine 1-carboxyvinyltransferase [Brachyspira hyodysenteriae]MCZ9892211.1 UDP-N-acetylglucosamine 1-carboxyvinyltransferase [Brachyspira hyodysenteriae]MCZ9989759.1 UDP-N-acetylglucosamine 1-carboxyvinyltransferase [Brachyspira hyodysenteriae]MCZ9998125.1 UDP-N-acetylglucosamine 1-carboxyvinyltransferase [Brachyspira hyodysenteriae]MDA0001559.1 UDP-N-acetylglucosamine 1-carboxyvinyltran
MYKYVIEGSNNIGGILKVSGSKNASLPLLVASILTDEPVILHNVPDLVDVHVLIDILEPLGKKVDFKNNTTVIISHNGKSEEAPYKLVKKMRGSIIVLGPLLAKRKHCRVSYPGGCAFGPRPIDLHLKGMEALGAKIDITAGYIDAKVEGNLIGADMDLSGKFGPTVLGTDNVMMAAALAKGTTIIRNAAKEPECTNLVDLLNAMGAKITGGGTDTLSIEGVDGLHGAEFTVIPDRIETGTFLAIAAAGRGKLKLENAEPKHLTYVLDLLSDIGCDIKTTENTIEIDARNKELKPFKVETLPYPGFPTDLQAIYTTLACTINGKSELIEGIYPDRFSHVPELIRMGADIELNTSDIVVNGGKELSGADVQASDLRAGAALVAAGAIAKGATNVHRIYHIERGYENLEDKLKSINIETKKEKDDIL